jgi:predicted glycosyltransferase
MNDLATSDLPGTMNFSANLRVPARPVPPRGHTPDPFPGGRDRQRPFRVLTYSHDSFGLGHLRRSVTLATALVQQGPHVHALCLTGSPVPDLFELPDRCDLVKIPAIGKGDQGQYVARRLPVSFHEIAALRTDLISATVRAFRPDLLLVDHTATGPGEELVPVLRRLRCEGFHTRVVLGLRDVLDTPERARAEMHHSAIFPAIRSSYDQVFVYGQREVFDTISEYQFPQDIAEKTTFVGAVVPAAARALRHIERNDDPPHVVATVGGGEDGYPLLRAVIAALRGPLRSAGLRATIIAGPLMPEAAADRLRRAVQDDARITLRRQCGDIQTLLDSADLVIGMGGYNTVYESLARGVATLIRPRRKPRAEQWERCRRLAATGHLELFPDAALGDPHRCADAITGALARGARPAFPLRFDGADNVARLCLAQPRTRSAIPWAATG